MIEIPEYFSYLGKGALLNTKEVAAIFNITSVSIIRSSNEGRFPKPHTLGVKSKLGSGNIATRSNCPFWTKEAVIGEINRRNSHV